MDNPTYYNLGLHSETIQIDYDPTKISYTELLAVFWDSHDPTLEPISRQYMSKISYHTDEQKRLAMETKEQEEARRGRSIQTSISAFLGFHLAEYYHQKYYLQQDNVFMKEFKIIYPAPEDFINSTAAARINGYAGGYGTLDTLQKELDSLGLSEAGSSRLLEIADRGLKPGCVIN